MSEPLKPIGFWSYTRDDDTRSRGRLTQLRTLLAEELQGKLGRAEQVRIFQDAAAISYGARWERQIDAALEECSFFIPIVTPGFLQSEWCCKELGRFRARQTALGRDDLIFPLHYIDVSDVNPDRAGEVFDRAAWECIGQQQTIDFRALRFEQPDSSVAVARLLDALAQAIRGALRREVVAALAPPGAPPPQSGAVGSLPVEAPISGSPTNSARDSEAQAPTMPSGRAEDPMPPAPSPAPEEPPVRTSVPPSRTGGTSQRPGTRLHRVGSAFGIIAVLLGVIGAGAMLLQRAPLPTQPPAQRSNGGNVSIPQASSAPAAAGAAPARGSVMRDCPTCPEMVLVPAGSFTMGVPPGESVRDGVLFDDDKDARPLRTVTFAHAFWLGKYPVTRAEYAEFVHDANYTAGGKGWQDGDSDRDPVVNVSPADAEAYAAWLSSPRKTGKPYRLPSEAEWEYAARAVTAPGPTPARFWGNDFEHTAACHYANVSDEALRKQSKASPDKNDYFVCDDGHAGVAPVGSYQPNAFGLYDMLGNVWQWTADCYTNSYDGAPDDGSARTSGDCSRRVLRGGSWHSSPAGVRAGVRIDYDQGYLSARVGFRLARTQ
ncbi:MAG TPA: SUMF1/EgtB/PvdO family nonheme iron enzyme [Acetobacteraceae bacterium]